MHKSMVLWSVYRHVCPKSCRDSTRDQCVSTLLLTTVKRHQCTCGMKEDKKCMLGEKGMEKVKCGKLKELLLVNAPPDHHSSSHGAGANAAESEIPA